MTESREEEEEEVKFKAYTSHNQSNMLVGKGTTYVEPLWIHSAPERRGELKEYTSKCQFNNML